MSATRHLDTGRALLHFADDVLVHCPDCDRVGRVVRRTPDERLPMVFACKGCGLALETPASPWFGPVVRSGRRPCGHCGHRWLVVSGRVDDDTPSGPVPAECRACGGVSPVDVGLFRAIPSDRAIDPHFGLALLLKTDCRHGTVWAYGERHLHELQSWIGAALRERRDSGNGSMFSRLPHWMKLAGHRDEILKQLGRLEAMLADAPPAAARIPASP